MRFALVINPGTIDAALCAVPGVTAGAAVLHGVPARLAAFYSADTDLEEAIQAALTERLPRCMVPSQLYWLPQLPRMPGGEIDRQLLAALAASSPELAPAAPRRAPRNATEQDLLQRFARHLDVPVATIDIDDDFFALGGHTLPAARLLQEVNERWQSALSLADLVKRPTVAELARALPGAPAEEIDDWQDMLADLFA
ncbi:MAG TPA: phosphopantetheine-binding protein [Pseudoduganella sp.]|jgi:nonribosomal peptide synthetase DhbF